jgi:peptide-methionine (R)-S-oxide reductase
LNQLRNTGSSAARILAAAFLILASCAPAPRGTAGTESLKTAEPAAKPPTPSAPVEGDSIRPLVKTIDEWRRLVPGESFRVLFENGTEMAGTSPLNLEKRKGTFVCAACNLPLFESDTKYESGTGWPSFYAAIPGRLGTSTDHDIGYPRTEYHCVRCGGHQGHVFDDGPPPTGKRFCNNGVALRFVPQGEPLPELRS